MRNGILVTARVMIPVAMAMAWLGMPSPAAAQNMTHGQSQCTVCNQGDGSCHPYCGPEYYTQWGQYGTQYGARMSDRAKSRCLADGSCIPNRPTWGHYEQRWRRWPVAVEGARPSEAPTRPILPPYETPPMEQESQRSPLMSAPIPSQEPGMNGEVSPPAEVPMPNVPIPESPIPTEPPTTSRRLPAVPEGSGPPALPASLSALQRTMARHGAAPGAWAPLTTMPARTIARLPVPNTTTSRQNSYPVESASVVIAADGEAVAESRVKRAMHWTPVPDKN